MGFTRFSKWLVLMAALSFGSLLQAKERVLLIGPRGASLSKAMLDSASRTLRILASEYDFMEIVESDLKNIQAQAACTDTRRKCIRKMGKVAGAQKVLLTQVKKLPGRRMMIMKLVNVASGKLVKQSRQKVRKGRNSLVRALKKGWASVFGRIVQCRIRVDANTENARVLLDGMEKGTTPLTLDGKFRAGVHTLTVLHQDTLPAEKRIVIKPGRRNLRYRFQLKLKPDNDEDLVLVPLVRPRSVDHKAKRMAKAEVAKSDHGKAAAVSDDAGEPGGSPKKPVMSDDAGEPGGSLKKSVMSDDAGEPGGGLKKSALSDDAGEPGGGLKRADDSAGQPFVSVANKENQIGRWSSDGNEAASTPVYKTWWFWTAVGVVAAAGIVTATVIGLSGGDEGIPAGMGRVVIEF